MKLKVGHKERFHRLTLEVVVINSQVLTLRFLSEVNLFVGFI